MSFSSPSSHHSTLYLLFSDNRHTLNVSLYSPTTDFNIITRIFAVRSIILFFSFRYSSNSYFLPLHIMLLLSLELSLSFTILAMSLHLRIGCRLRDPLCYPTLYRLSSFLLPSTKSFVFSMNLGFCNYSYILLYNLI